MVTDIGGCAAGVGVAAALLAAPVLVVLVRTGADLVVGQLRRRRDGAVAVALGFGAHRRALRKGPHGPHVGAGAGALVAGPDVATVRVLVNVQRGVRRVVGALRRAEIVMLCGLARRTARKSRKHHYFTRFLFGHHRRPEK